MAATPKPVRKEVKKLDMAYKKMDKKDPVLKADSKNRDKKEHKKFIKHVAESRVKGK